MVVITPVPLDIVRSKDPRKRLLACIAVSELILGCAVMAIGLTASQSEGELTIAVVSLAIALIAGALFPFRIQGIRGVVETSFAPVPMFALIAMGYPRLAAATYILGAVAQVVKTRGTYGFLSEVRALGSYMFTIGVVTIACLNESLMEPFRVKGTDLGVAPVLYLAALSLLVDIFDIVLYYVFKNVKEGMSFKEAVGDDLSSYLTENFLLGFWAPFFAFAAFQLPVLLVPLYLTILSMAFNSQLALRRQTEKSIDPLTGLPNRVALADLAEQAVTDARRGRQSMAVLVVDLDGFKAVNDSLGHEAGDQLLIEVGKRFRSVCTATVDVFRTGGDEFVFIAQKCESTGAVITGDNIVASLSEPIETAGEQVIVGASVGISLYPYDSDNFDDLMQKADFAMYKAKTEKLGVHMYDESSDRRQESKKVVVDLRGQTRAAGDIEPSAPVVQ